MNTPDFTLGQLVALITGAPAVVAEFLFAFGAYDLSKVQIDALNHGVTFAGVLAIGIFGADAIIRHGRARLLAPPPQVVVGQPGSPSSYVEPGEDQAVE